VRIAGPLLTRLQPKIAGVPHGLSGEWLLEAIVSSRSREADR
jgi:hypothetical protein